MTEHMGIFDRPTDRFTVNRNEGTDTLHRNARESCNTDDAKGMETVDAATADALLLHGSAVRCHHCWGET